MENKKYTILLTYIMLLISWLIFQDSSFRGTRQMFLKIENK